jgi:hypothetical protein
MKQLVMTKGERFDIETVRPQIEAIVDAFDLYLDEYVPKTRASKQGIMGPVGLILQGAKTRKDDVTTLLGRARRAHEMSQRSGFLSVEALTALEMATTQLVELCRSVPVTAVPKVVERVDYSLYYIRRKKDDQRYQEAKAQFADFLRQRYPSDAALAAAWAENVSFDSIPYPSRKVAAQGNDAKRKDIDNFWKHIKGGKVEDLEEEEENE